MKRFISIILIMGVCMSCITLLANAQRDTSKEEILAKELKSLDLFKGVSETNFALNRAPSRIEALVMLVRVLGKEKEVNADIWKHPFNDVPNWADNYVGYAYSKGLTNGSSANQFGTEDANAAMYLTFVLRALGYSDTNEKDFSWENPYSLSRQIGILNDEVNVIEFLRADVVVISHAALSAYVNGTQQTLAQKLISAGVFTQNDFENIYNKNYKSESTDQNTYLTAEEIYAKCSPAVFYIEVYNENGSVKGSGSGFFVDGNGTAVTNFHVIDGCTSARITTSDSQKTYDVLGVYNYNISEDWAVIKVDCVNQKSLELGGEKSLIGGATIYTIGSPLGLQNTISQGLISNPKRYEDGVNYIQISAAISQGSSGGALLDVGGRVIGITSASYDNGQNLNLAIPISYVNIDTNSTLKQFNILEKTMEIEDPIVFLQDYLIKNGTSDALISTDQTIVEYSLEIEDANGAVFTISYAPGEEVMYISKNYSTKFNQISTNLYLSGAGTNEVAAKAMFQFFDSIETKLTIGYAFVYRELVKYPEYFEFYSMMDNAKLSQDAGEEICYGMIMDIIDAADYMFYYYNLPITMENFGYIY